jgi:hypothetical protein
MVDYIQFSREEGMVGKVPLFNAQIRNDGVPFFNGRRALTNTSSTNFTIGRFDKRKGGKEKAQGKIEINLVYVPSPLKRETLTLSGKAE